MELKKRGQGYLTTTELTRIIVPLSGCHAQIVDYVNFILWYRSGEITIAGWPDCCEGANDFRIAREYLLFLENYGYLEKADGVAKILSAIAEMRNKGSDSHGVGAKRISIADHHARLFVNSAMTMADFILTVSQKQLSNGDESKLDV